MFWLGLILISNPSFSADARVLLNRREASVGDQAILKSDVDAFRRTMPLRAQLDPLFANMPISQMGPKVTDQAIVEYLVADALVKNQFPVTDQEVEQEINAIQSNNRIDRAGLTEALKAQGFSFQEYFTMMKSGVSKRQLIDRDIRTKVHISDDDLRVYYETTYRKQNPPSGASAGNLSFHIQLLAVTPKNYKTLATARQVIAEAQQAIQKGESFDVVAKRVSDDPSASTGGDLGFLTPDEMAPDIAKEVKKLRPGATSGILGNDKTRFFLLRLVETKSTVGDDFAKAKDSIQNILTAQEFSRQINLWIERQKVKTTVHFRGSPAVPEIKPTS
jgi:peptidyl-prolyl cis-trans isomerase SurA